MSNRLANQNQAGDDVGDAVVDLLKQNCMSALEQFNTELDGSNEDKLIEAIKILS